jgi:adenine-specific DNA methylase
MAEMTQSSLRHIDQALVSLAAKAETRNRERHLPPISVYRWWARRTEAVNGALLDAAAKELSSGSDLLVADPFVGGGVIALAALKRGHRIYAQDLNPWVAEGLASMLSLPDCVELEAAGKALREAGRTLANRAYGTTFSDGAPAQVSHSLRVAVTSCSQCGHSHRLFPHALVTLTKRKDRGGRQAFLACRRGHLFHSDTAEITRCPECEISVDPTENYQPRRTVTCPRCGHQEDLEVRARLGAWAWSLVLVERSDGIRRELAFPTASESKQAHDQAWKPKRRLGSIPDSPETRVLRRHGFKSWADLYPKRQRYVMEQLLRLVRSTSPTPTILKALTMALLGTAEMAGLLSRWDRYYLKSYESMASHRFNFTTLAVEPNLLGVGLHGRGTLQRRMRLFEKAAAWFEANKISHSVEIRLNDEERLEVGGVGRVTIVAGSSERNLLPDGSADLILTDPPYHDDVQYHELSLPFRVWANLKRSRLLGEAVAIPHCASLGGHKAYRGVLRRIFGELRRSLKPDGRLLFSYANREPAAWVNLFGALRESGFRPLGYTILHSENEGDHAKRKGRACNLDLILELVPAQSRASVQWRPDSIFHTDEERYLMTVGDAFLASGTLVNGWEVELVTRLRSEIFVSLKVEPPSGQEHSESIVASDTYTSARNVTLEEIQRRAE